MNDLTQYNFLFTKQSGNKKTGIMPVTTSSKNTCPDTCALKLKGCYAKSGALAIHWNRLTDKGLKFDELLKNIKKLNRGTLWRHNQAGDLIGNEDIIDHAALKQLTNANKDKMGFTYTHYPMAIESNREAVKTANNNGFTVNVSCDNITMLDKLKKLDPSIPAVVILPLDSKKVSYTQENHKIVVCPAQSSDKVNCSTCKLCAVSDRKYTIGFLAHGTSKKSVNELASV